MMTMSELFDKDALATLIAEDTILGADLKMGLNTAIIPVNKQLTIGDMTEPTYAGYARQLVVLGAPFRDLQYEISALAAALTFQQGGAITPCLIQGVFLVYGATPKFAGYEALSQPFQMNDGLDALTLVFQYIQSNDKNGFVISIA